MRIALLDDYQDVALKLAPWRRLPASCEVVVFNDHLHDEDAIVARLADFDAVMAMREGGETLDALLWGFVDGEPQQNRFRTLAELPAQTEESRAMSKELKRRGFRFVGPTVCYALMQAVGMANDHVVSCFRHRELAGR